MASPDAADGLRDAVRAIEAQRSVLGDPAADAALAPLIARLRELDSDVDEPESAPVSLRRQATVMFADLSGYTTLSEQVDPERVRLMLRELWQAVDGIIESHRGTVVQHMGDGAMAIWSGERSEEDDAEEAVLAALEAVDWLATNGVDVAGERRPAQMSIGIHTGPVNIGLVGTGGQLSAIGDTVNVAARLEGVAAPGEVVMSRSTYHQVRGIFDVTDAGALSLKGRSTPVQAYRVERRRPRAFRTRLRGVEGLDTTMTGRDRELAVLTDAHERLIGTSTTSVVSVVGEPGIGKSRLLSEYRDWIDLSSHPVRYFEGRCVPHDVGRAYSLLRDVLMHRFEITDSDGADAAERKFRAGVDALLGPGSAPAFAGVSRLVGLRVDHASESPGPAQHQEDRLAAVELFRRLPGAGQAVMFLEDLHWADPASLVLLGELVSSQPPGWLVVATSRPDPRPAVAEWSTEHALGPRHQVIRLRSLDDRGVLELVDDVLRLVDEIPDELRRLIAERADGNPLFVEEVIKMLVDDEVIVPGEPWTVHLDRLRPGRLPGTLTGILQSRLDHLEPAQRRVLQLASVFGRYFWDTGIAELADRPLDQVQSDLRTIRATELVYSRRPSRFVGSDEFVFKHDVTRAVTYDTLALGERSALHRAAARWLEGVGAHEGSDLEVPIARHLDAAGDRVAAGRAYRRAAQLTTGRGAYREATDLLELAIERLADDHEQRNGAQLELAYAMVVSGSFDAAKSRLNELRQTAVEDGDVKLQMAVAGELARIAMLRDGDFGTARALLDGGLALAAPGDHLDEELALRHQLGNLAIVDGRWTDAETELSAILHHRERMQPRQRGLTLNSLAHAHAQLGRYDDAVAIAAEVATLADEIADRRLAMAAIAQHGLAALITGRLDEAWERFSAAQELNRSNGDREKEATVANFLGEVALADGRTIDAAHAFADALRLGSEFGVAIEVIRAVVGGAAVAAETGDRDAAARILAAADRHGAAAGRSRELSAWVRTRFDLPDPPEPGAEPTGEELAASVLALLERIVADDASHTSSDTHIQRHTSTDSSEVRHAR